MFITVMIRVILLLLLFSFLSLFSFSSDLKGFSYKPGRGLKIKFLKTTVGGYITSVYEKSQEYEEFSIDDIAFLIYGKPVNRLRYFLELELDDSYSVVNGNERVKKKIDFERAYIDIETSDALKLRVGRFITPVGLWNPIHINVLKWTTSDPLTATKFFPKFTTGIQLFGELPEGFSYSLFLQKNKGISESYNNFLARKLIGGEVRKEFSDNIKAGLNGGWFEIRVPKEELTFLGLNAIYKIPRIELSAEFMYGVEKEKYIPGNSIWSYRLSYYLQGVYRIVKGNYAVFRYGFFKDKSDRKNYRILTLGWNYRPVYYIALKAEYQFREKKELNKFLASFSWMF